MTAEKKCTDDVSSHDVEKQDGDASAEAGGIARGAARTASSLSRRAVVGRVPKPVAAPRITLPTPRSSVQVKVPRGLPKRIPLKRVAKVSDRLSTGFDAYDAASSVLEEGNGNSKGKSSSTQQRHTIIDWLKTHGARVGSFGGSKWKPNKTDRH